MLIAASLAIVLVLFIAGWQIKNIETHSIDDSMPPIDGEISVIDHLIEKIELDGEPGLTQKIREDIFLRKEFLKKRNYFINTNDGRNSLIDAYQDAIDLYANTYKVYLETGNTSSKKFSDTAFYLMIELKRKLVADERNIPIEVWAQ